MDTMEQIHTPAKIQAIEEMKLPATITEARKFAELCGYCRKFVKDFLILAGRSLD